MAARGLGKGLDTLIPNAMGDMKKSNSPKKNEVVDEKGQETVVKITKVEPNREQPRKKFDEEALKELSVEFITEKYLPTLKELSDSIKQFGLLQPILVQDRKTYYEIIAGERRWRAAKMAGLKEIPVIIKNFTEQEIVEISLIENIQREDLNPIEEALTYKRLLTEFHLKQEELADRVSKNRTTITNSMRLLKLCDEVQQMIIDDKLSTGHARALIGIEDKDVQKELAEKIYQEKLSVREVEKLIKSIMNPKEKKEPKKKDQSLELIYRDIEEKLKQSLGTKVSISSKENGAGKLEIEFFSHEELDRITEFFMKKGE